MHILFFSFLLLNCMLWNSLEVDIYKDLWTDTGSQLGTQLWRCRLVIPDQSSTHLSHRCVSPTAAWPVSCTARLHQWHRARSGILRGSNLPRPVSSSCPTWVGEEVKPGCPWPPTPRHGAEGQPITQPHQSGAVSQMIIKKQISWSNEDSFLHLMVF